MKNVYYSIFCYFYTFLHFKCRLKKIETIFIKTLLYYNNKYKNNELKELKTGIYYLRRKAKQQAYQFTIEPKNSRSK